MPAANVEPYLPVRLLLLESAVASISCTCQTVDCVELQWCMRIKLACYGWEYDLKGHFRSFESFRFNKLPGGETWVVWFSCANCNNRDLYRVNGQSTAFILYSWVDGGKRKDDAFHLPMYSGVSSLLTMPLKLTELKKQTSWVVS